MAPRKPVIAVLQAWNRKPHEDGTAGSPTTAQSRFMAYQAVIRGAKGILYYGVMRVSKPHPASSIPAEISPDPKIAERDFQEARQMNDAFWVDFKAVVKEIDGMGATFAARAADWTPQVKLIDSPQVTASDLQLYVKQTPAGSVVLLVNASEHPVQISLIAPQLGPTIYLWHDQRELIADSAGAVADTLEPYAVRVYASHAQPRQEK